MLITLLMTRQSQRLRQSRAKRIMTRYTAETRDALAGALAIDVAGKKYSEQSVVDAATKAINDAVAALEVMTYNAIFTVDGAQYEVVPTKVGEQIVAPQDPAKEGYVFKGWDKEVGKMGVEDITFAAQFEEASGIAYTVEVYTMDVNGNYGAADFRSFWYYRLRSLQTQLPPKALPSTSRQLMLSAVPSQPTAASY